METFARDFINECCSHRFSKAQSMFRLSGPQRMGWKVDLVVARATAGEAWGGRGS